MGDLFGSVVLVTNSDEFLAERFVQQRQHKAARIRPDSELTVLEGATTGVGDLAEAVSGSLFSSASVVTIADVGALGSAAQGYLLDSLAAVSDDVCMTLVHAGGQKGRAFIAKLKKVPQVEVVEQKLARNGVKNFVVAEGKAHKIKFAPDALEELVLALGSDLRTLAAGVAQLAYDCDGGQVTKAEVSKYFGGRAEVSAFKIADDLLFGRVRQSLAQTRWALETGVSPVQITSAVASRLRSLGRYTQLQRSSKSGGEIAQMVGVPPWKLRTLGQQMTKWTARGLAQAIHVVAEADAGVKGGGKDPGYTVERMILDVERARASA